MRTRAALRLVRLVKILKGAFLVAATDFRLEVGRELLLVCDGLQDSLLASLKFIIIGEAFLNLANLNLVEIAMRLLAVARDEWNGGTFAKKFFDGRNLMGANAQFGRHAGENFSCHGEN